MTPLKVEMQTHCPSCGIEVYGPAVYKFSYGEVPCPLCGGYSEPMDTSQYCQVMKLLREKEDAKHGHDD
jgi:uncharacterized Zn finger protein (UPF0148 family)